MNLLSAAYRLTANFCEDSDTVSISWRERERPRLQTPAVHHLWTTLGFFVADSKMQINTCSQLGHRRAVCVPRILRIDRSNLGVRCDLRTQMSRALRCGQRHLNSRDRDGASFNRTTAQRSARGSSRRLSGDALWNMYWCGNLENGRTRGSPRATASAGV